MFLGAATAAYAPAANAADASPPTDDPCGPLVAHLEAVVPGGVVTPNVYVGDGLTSYLQRDDKEPRASLALASAACREDVRRSPSGRLPALVRDVLARPEPGWVNAGRVVACATQDPAHLSAVPEWLGEERFPESRAACFATIATWPRAQAIRLSAFDWAVRMGADGWYVDPALLAVVGIPNELGPEMRDQLARALRAAEDKRAVGFGSLRAGVCISNERWSPERTQMCSKTSTTAEARWRDDENRGRTWAIRLGATVPYAGGVALAYAGRNSDVGLGIATGAGALAGASLGVLLGAWLAWADADDDFVEVAAISGALLLGTLGGIAAYAAVDDAPQWRVPVTAGALFIPLTIVWGSAHLW